MLMKLTIGALEGHLLSSLMIFEQCTSLKCSMPYLFLSAVNTVDGFPVFPGIHELQKTEY